MSLSLGPCDLADPVVLEITVVGKDGKPQIAKSYDRPLEFWSKAMPFPAENLKPFIKYLLASWLLHPNRNRVPDHGLSDQVAITLPHKFYKAGSSSNHSKFRSIVSIIGHKQEGTNVKIFVVHTHKHQKHLISKKDIVTQPVFVEAAGLIE